MSQSLYPVSEQPTQTSQQSTQDSPLPWEPTQNSPLPSEPMQNSLLPWEPTQNSPLPWEPTQNAPMPPLPSQVYQPVYTPPQPTQNPPLPVQPTPAKQPTPAQQPVCTPEQSTQVVEVKPKRVHYTPELKLLILRLCIEHKERYLEEPTEFAFWQFITALFREKTGHQGADLRKKVGGMVGDRKAALEARKLLSGVALPPTTDLEQAIDLWIEACDRRNELRESIKTEDSIEVKREKAVSEVLRDNLTKRLSKKRDFQAVVEAREVIDLTAPGDIRRKRRQIRENLRTKKEELESGSKDKMREDFSKLTEVFIDYMTKPSKCSCSHGSNTGCVAFESSKASSSESKSTESAFSETTKLAVEVADIQEKLSRFEANQENIKELLLELVKGKGKEQV